MTIGIAASGPNAAEAIIAALAAVEAIGSGAIGGFVSLAAIGNGMLYRAETQTGGSRTLFKGAIPASMAAANLAVLMSSGPNRPAPLAQFTPGDASVGLVTGHRFPNAPGENGLALNEDVLGLMRAGVAPEPAIAAVLGRNAFADAGLIALSLDGFMHAANSKILDSFGDRGQVVMQSESGAKVAVLHNAILPYRGLAQIAAEVALNLLDSAYNERMNVEMDIDTAIVLGPENAVELGQDNRVISITVDNPRLLSGYWSFGLGYRAKVHRHGQILARLAYEPYLVALDGRLVAIDGSNRATLQAMLE